MSARDKNGYLHADENGRFVSQDENGSTTRKLPFHISMNFFGDKSLKNQTPTQIRKGMRKLNRRINEHKHKISNPQEYWKDWDSFTDERKQNELNHWKSEINRFELGIKYRQERLQEVDDE